MSPILLYLNYRKMLNVEITKAEPFKSKRCPQFEELQFRGPHPLVLFFINLRIKNFEKKVR